MSSLFEYYRLTTTDENGNSCYKFTLVNEEDQTKKLYLLDKLNKLVHDTNTNYANLLKHYKVKTNAEMTIEQLEDAIKKLEAKL